MKGGVTVGRLLNRLFANSVASVEENARDGETVRIFVSKWVFIWKNDVFIGCHKTK